jgi:hypothetical protein
MKKLVDNISVGEVLVATQDVLDKVNRFSEVISEGDHLSIVGDYLANGEGIGFILEDKSGNEHRLSKSYGTYLTIASTIEK